MAGTLAETGGRDLQILQEVRGDLCGVERVNVLLQFGEQPFRFPRLEIIPVMPMILAKIWRHSRDPPTLVIPFMPGSLPEKSPAKVYVIHQTGFADDLFTGTSMADETLARV